MAADLCFISHATQRQPVELSPHGPGNRSPQRRFTNTWRAYKTENGALGRFVELPNCQKLKNSLFYFVQTIMVFIKNLLGIYKVKLVTGMFPPGNFKHPIKVCSNNGCFRGIRMHHFQTFKLL